VAVLMMKKIPTKIPMTMEYEKTILSMMKMMIVARIQVKQKLSNVVVTIKTKKIIPHAGDCYQLLPTDKYKMQNKQQGMTKVMKSLMIANVQLTLKMTSLKMVHTKNPKESLT